MPKDAELYRRIEEVVHYVWDPIGICQNPQARNEHSGYVRSIYGNGKADDLDGLIAYMRWVLENMGLQIESEKMTNAAQVMLDWKKYIDEP